MATFFTADSHFSDDSIRRVCRGPFETVDDMNRCMIEIWNACVRPGDTVWHFGDFSMHGKASEVATIFAALNGRLHLVKGNHDRKRVLDLPWAAPPVDIADVSVDGSRRGADSWAYAPIILDEIRSRLAGVTEETEEIRLARARAAERGEG